MPYVVRCHAHEVISRRWSGSRPSRRTPLTQVTSRISQRTHGAVRAAVDVELLDGFLWATAGYAYTTAATGRGLRSPTFGELSGHTLGLGLEASAGSFTFNLGWSRTWSTDRKSVV